jgi:hypothetical protein
MLVNRAVRHFYSGAFQTVFLTRHPRVDAGYPQNLAKSTNGKSSPNISPVGADEMFGLAAKLTKLHAV